MNTEDLDIFLKAYEYCNFSKAAEDFFITPQGARKMVHRLETELDCQLFTRGQKGMLPTEKADILATHARSILEDVQTLKASLNNPFYTQKTSLKVAFTAGILSYLTQDYRQGFMREHPDIDLQLMEYNDSEVDMVLRSDGAELGFQSEPIDFSFYDAVPFSSHEYVAVMNRSHPLAKKGQVTYADFHDEILCMLGPQYFSYNQNLNALMEVQARPKDIYTIRDTGSITSYAKSSRVIGLTVDFVANQITDPDVVFRSFSPMKMWHTCMIKKRGRILSHGADQFMKYSLEWLKKSKENL